MKFPPARIGLRHIDWVGLVLSTNLPPLSKFIVTYLSRFMNKDQDMAWPSQARIISETSISNGALNRHLSLLQSEGWLIREKGHSKKNTRYIVSFPKSVENSLLDVTNTPRDGVEHSQSGSVETIEHSQRWSRTLPEMETNSPSNSKYINPSSSEPEEDQDLITAEFIFSAIKKINPSHKKPNFDVWKNDIRRMREIDKRTQDDIFELYEWVNNDFFWQTNILSPKKLREKWDQLTIKKNQGIENCGKNKGYYETTSERVSRKLDEIAKRDIAENGLAENLDGGTI